MVLLCARPGFCLEYFMTTSPLIPPSCESDIIAKCIGSCNNQLNSQSLTLMDSKVYFEESLVMR